MENQEQRPKKKVEDSKTEWMHCLLYEDMNGTGRLFGGRIMEWLDQVAGITAMRHSGGAVTTAAVDNLQFKAGAYVNDLVVMVGKMTYVGRSSMEVRVDVYVEEQATGKRRVINRAYFTEVSVGEDGSPRQVLYGLEVETEAEKAEWEGALKRIEVRKQRRREGF